MVVKVVEEKVAYKVVRVDSKLAWYSGLPGGSYAFLAAGTLALAGLSLTATTPQATLLNEEQVTMLRSELAVGTQGAVPEDLDNRLFILPDQNRSKMEGQKDEHYRDMVAYVSRGKDGQYVLNTVPIDASGQILGSDKSVKDYAACFQPTKDGKIAITEKCEAQVNQMTALASAAVSKGADSEMAALAIHQASAIGHVVAEK